MTKYSRHVCRGDLPQVGYGPAITYCWEDEEEKLWVGNGEYSSQVNYCPFCGFCAPTQVVDKVTTQKDIELIVAL